MFTLPKVIIPTLATVAAVTMVSSVAAQALRDRWPAEPNHARSYMEPQSFASAPTYRAESQAYREGLPGHSSGIQTYNGNGGYAASLGYGPDDQRDPHNNR